MKLALLLGLLSLPLLAAVDGTVVNQTTGQPQPKASVTLFRVGGGMEAVKTVDTDAQGKFSIDDTPQGPALLQVNWEGVTYNTMVPPGTPSANLTLKVYDASKNADAKTTQHMVLLEPSDSGLAVSESIFVVNSGKTTYSDPGAGSFRFYMPAAANGDVRVTISEPQAIIPLQRPAEKTGQADVYKVNFPIKPGETRFDLSYQLPKSASFTGRVLHKEGATRLVAPSGVTLKGDGIVSLGPEPRTQAMIYDVKAPDYTVAIEGTGALRQQEAEAPADEEDSGQGLQEIKPRVYDRIYWILGLGLAILMLGFIVLYRSSPVQAPPVPSPKRAARK